MTRGWRYAQLSRVLLLLGAAAIASPAAAQLLYSGAPPWAVDAPGAAESRFALGLILLGERQESLRIAAFDQLVEVEDLRTGRVETSRLTGDAALLERKFDVRFEQQGVGSSFAVALPSPVVSGTGRLFPTIGIHAVEADVSLDFDDVTAGRDSTALHGRGPLFATTFDVATTPCSQCSWFAAAGVRFEKLPSLAVERSPRFGLQGFAVSRDDVQLEREVGEVSSRVGYRTPGGRTASFVGVQHRWTDLEIDDRLAYRNVVAETRLSSRTRLESETTLALAGVDVALSRRFLGRLETAVGGGDAVVRLGAVYLPAFAHRPLTDPRLPQIAEAIGRLHAEFSREVAALPAVGRLAAARALLDKYERALCDLLPLPEFAAMQSYVIYEFELARAALASLEATAARDAARHRGLRSRREYVPVRWAQDEDLSLADKVDEVCASLGETFKVLARHFGNNDVEIELCVQSDPRPRKVFLVPRIYAGDPTSQHWKEFRTNYRRQMSRGLYAYRVVPNVAGKSEPVMCAGMPTCTPLDLLEDDHPFVVCKPDGSPAGAFECTVEDRERKWWKCDRVEP